MTILNFQKLLKTPEPEGMRVAEAKDQQDAAEELALALTSHGLQRMTARVLVSRAINSFH
jgi:hypothetical protein